MKNLFFLIFILAGCETYIYNDYKIIDLKNKQKEKFINFSGTNYLVKKGDNLYSISRKFKISIQELIRKNNIVEPYKIFPNQKIFIPKNYIHKVKKGDTLYSISRKYETNIFELSKINNIKDINNLVEGQKLKISNGVFHKKKVKTTKNKINKKEEKKKLKKPLNKIKDKGMFLWPVKGEIVSSYGKNKQGFYNDGININSREGSKVISSADGKVIYCGNEIPGYGNLVLIKHSKNWITAYAHLNEVFIKKGKVVKRGEKIGSVGSTGNVQTPQLHFEIRKGKESVDPLRLL